MVLRTCLAAQELLVCALQWNQLGDVVAQMIPNLRKFRIKSCIP